MKRKKHAFISAAQKPGIEKFAKFLFESGYRLFASCGTAKYLKEQGIVVTSLQYLVDESIGALADHIGYQRSRLGGFPPQIHFALTADQEHREFIIRNGHLWLDLLFVRPDLTTDAEYMQMAYPRLEEDAEEGTGSFRRIRTPVPPKALRYDVGALALVQSAIVGSRYIAFDKETIALTEKCIAGELTEKDYRKQLLKHVSDALVTHIATMTRMLAME